jgi:D-alanyl-D-alanine carboxypeptidase (penicillin-binding protein 5/6)
VRHKHFNFEVYFLSILWFLPSLLLAAAPPLQDINAKAYYLVDMKSGAVLAQKNARMPIEPASLTKLMTEYGILKDIAAGKFSLDTVVKPSEKAWRQEGSRMFIEPNKAVTVKELLYGVIVQSGNDACVALAELAAGTEEIFAMRMNEEAKKLGMKNSFFVNATGLPDPKERTTVEDLAILTKALIRDFPEHYKIHGLKEYTYNGIRQMNRNLLLWRDPSVDGVKTGHTQSAGYNLIASAQKGDMRLIAVVIGTDSEKARASETAKLLNYGFAFFRTYKVFSSHSPLKEVPVRRGKQSTIKIGPQDDVYLTVPKGEYEKVKATIGIMQPLLAPIFANQVVGHIRFNLDGKTIAKAPLITLENVAEAGFWGKLLEKLENLF